MRKALLPSVVSLALVTASCGRTTLSQDASEIQSLTAANAPGKKLYLGFGEFLDGFMGNEVMFDVKHTHDIFTNQIGGAYQGTKLTERQVSGEDVKQSWNAMKAAMSKDDMYVQYSSGHGFQGGLAIGVSHEENAQNALSLPAKEVIVFMMACYSGGLVDTFNQMKSQWQGWGAQGRTLFVMASSTAAEESSTGPGTDQAEASGPEGSAGSAYGHALWKSLIGESDGFVDGVKDGFISLQEIAAYATFKTQQVGGHTPQVTGVYNPFLIMNKVPGGGAIRGLTQQGGTYGKTDAQIRAEIAQADAQAANGRPIVMPLN